MSITWKCLYVFFVLSRMEVHGAGKVFTPFQFNAKGDGKSNDTMPVQLALDAAANAEAGTLWIPPHRTFLIGAPILALGHKYDGVTIQIDGVVQVIPPPAVWAGCTREYAKGQCLTSTFSFYNVDGVTMTSKTNGTLQGFMFDEHAPGVHPGAPYFLNSTNILMENFAVKHLAGSAWFHNCQNVMFRSMYAYNRGNPEETGNLEVGGIGSHGAPWPPLGWQYIVPLLSANNITIRDSYFNGGDDNICIKNDTSNVLVENCSMGDGHGASIGSTPDCNGCYGYVENVTFRGITMLGDAPLKIKTWANTTGVIKNILFEDITLANAGTLVEISAWYGKCTWCHDYGTSTSKCIVAPGFGAWGGACTQNENNIGLENITLRHIRGKVASVGQIICREPRPCTINMEDIQIEAKQGLDCANAIISSGGTTVTPPLPTTCRTGPHLNDLAFV